MAIHGIFVCGYVVNHNGTQDMFFLLSCHQSASIFSAVVFIDPNPCRTTGTATLSPAVRFAIQFILHLFVGLLGSACYPSCTSWGVSNSAICCYLLGHK